MAQHRFFIQDNFQQIKLKIFVPEFRHQIKNVLRCSPGEKIFLFNGFGKEAEARIEEITDQYVQVQIDKVSSREQDAKRQVVLFCSILKKDNFEWVCQKATEAGLTAIVPILTGRTIKVNINADRLEKIIKEASEQSHRLWMPKLELPMTLEKATEKDEKDCDLNLFFDCFAKDLLSSQSSILKNSHKKIGIFIGPEGGWTESDRNLARDKKFVFVGLGDLVLRAETAAVVATYLAAHF